MEVYLKSRKGLYEAVADYNMADGKITIKKGSSVSPIVHNSPTFTGRDKIVKMRSIYTKNNVLTSDLSFSSPSPAANFVSGSSKNGWIAWEDKAGNKLKYLVNK